MPETIALESIGQVFCTRKALRDDGWDEERAYIRLWESLDEDALLGLDTFSHALIVFLMDRVQTARIETGARRPRNNPAWPRVGILAQRGKNRPNRIGVTVAAIDRVEGRCLYLRGLDAVDATPVLDIKPWVREFGPRGRTLQPDWMNELMADYWLLRSGSAGG